MCSYSLYFKAFRHFKWPIAMPCRPDHIALFPWCYRPGSLPVSFIHHKLVFCLQITCNIPSGYRMKEGRRMLHHEDFPQDQDRVSLARYYNSYLVKNIIQDQYSTHFSTIKLSNSNWIRNIYLINS